MATFTSIFVPGKDGTGSVTTMAAGTGVTLGIRTMFAINGTGDMNIVFYNASNAKVPTASNFRIPSGVTAVYDLSDYYDSFAIFNNTGGTVTYWWQTLNRG